MTPRRHLALTVLLCVVAGTLLLWVADGRAADAFGWVALAGVLGIAASRGRTRIPVGIALGVAGWFAMGHHVIAGALLLAAGVQVAANGPRWPALGARYDAPSARPATDADLWTAMDRGEDPTE